MPVTNFRRPRREFPAHLAFIRKLPCLITGRSIHVEAAHIRYANQPLGKRQTGIGEKPSDIWVVPLSAEKHRLDVDAQHNGNERDFWERHGIDPCVVALALWAHTGDEQTARAIIRLARTRGQ